MTPDPADPADRATSGPPPPPSTQKPLLIFANRISPTMSEVSLPYLARQALAQAPRKVWLAGPGDILASPVEIPPDFLRYACGLLGHDPAELAVLTVPAGVDTTLADAVRDAGLLGRVRGLADERPGIELLPYALDRPTAEFSAETGVPLHGYGPSGVSEDLLGLVHLLNSKTGFREVAGRLGLRIPAGAPCPDAVQLANAARKMGKSCAAVVVKPDRAANGYGVLFLSRDDPVPWERTIARHLRELPAPPSGWIVEKCVAPALDASVQMWVEPSGARVGYVGEMRTLNGSFEGYLAPPDERSVRAAKDALVDMGSRFGHFLAGRGYHGPLSIDARVTPDGTAYAIESNVRRTATTTVDVLVRRLTRAHADRPPVWLCNTRPAPRAPAGGFPAAVERLGTSGLAYDTTNGEGVVLLNDTFALNGTCTYLVVGADHGRVREQERALTAALGLD
ncbi:peptide ligase PGM1-related protein [Streptomyces sp. NPDC059785]|uniref:preATP grasp domain-containing protein n=1 Tax=unclassified Streptomyces TaxID=2593676 RepID=UPI00365F1948